MIETIELLEGRITVHPDRCNGKPTIRGLRIAVKTVLGLLSAGESFEEILRQYPSLELADIDACLRFADETRAYRADPRVMPDAARGAGDISELFGKVQIDPDYDYKTLRRDHPR